MPNSLAILRQDFPFKRISYTVRISSSEILVHLARWTFSN